MTRTAGRAITAIALGILIALTAILSGPSPERATASGGPALQPPFDFFSLMDIGVAPGFTDYLGPVVFAPNNPDTLIYGLLIGDDGVLNTIGVQRDANGHITGFDGDPAFFANADANDGGADFAPNGVLFVTTYGSGPEGNLMLQYKPGSTNPDKVTDLSTIGIPGSVGALRFVPSGFAGAGQLKIASYDGNKWYTVPFTENGAGTYDLGIASFDAQFADGTGPESPVYVSPGLGFSAPSVLVAEYNANAIGAYEIDAGGDPVPGTRRTFIADSSSFNPAGMVRDPVTGDAIIADYDSGNVYVVAGFAFIGAKGDLNCDGNVNGGDVITSIRHAAGADPDLPPTCPEIGEPYPFFGVASFDTFVGDMNCDSAVDEDDTLALLRYLGGLPSNSPNGCVPIADSF
jgi:hypothetical protein